MGKKFLLKMDNMSLKYLFNQPDLNARHDRWLAFLSTYHFKLKHIKGKRNKIVDSLSKRPHMLYEVTFNQTDSELHNRMRMSSGVYCFYVKSLKNI